MVYQSNSSSRFLSTNFSILVGIALTNWIVLNMLFVGAPDSGLRDRALHPRARGVARRAAVHGRGPGRRRRRRLRGGGRYRLVARSLYCTTSRLSATLHDDLQKSLQTVDNCRLLFCDYFFVDKTLSSMVVILGLLTSLFHFYSDGCA